MPALEIPQLIYTTTQIELPDIDVLGLTDEQKEVLHATCDAHNKLCDPLMLMVQCYEVTHEAKTIYTDVVRADTTHHTATSQITNGIHSTGFNRSTK